MYKPGHTWEKILRRVKCSDCPTEFETYGRQVKRCLPCRKEAILIRMRAQYKPRPARKIMCKGCGKEDYQKGLGRNRTWCDWCNPAFV